jgi:hypothetical protein
MDRDHRASSINRNQRDFGVLLWVSISKLLGSVINHLLAAAKLALLPVA